MKPLAGWLATRSVRERGFLAAAAAIAAAVVVFQVVTAIRDDLATLAAGVRARERELADVRHAAATLARSAPPHEPAGAPLARLETAAVAVVGRERIAAMTPTPAEAGEERVELRVAGTSLAETIALLHSLETATPPLHVARLEMRKHPDDAGRFDVTLEVAAPGTGS